MTPDSQEQSGDLPKSETCDYWACDKPRASDYHPGIRYCLIHEELA